MFEIRKSEVFPRNWWIMDGDFHYLHSDGSIYITAEYFPTAEAAQAVLDKFQPKHVWEHGDVFENCNTTKMIYLIIMGKPRAHCLGTCVGNHEDKDLAYNLKDATFLFNIKEKL